MLPFIKSAYFNDLLESFSNGIIIFNVAGRAYAVNDAACRILGVKRERLIKDALILVAGALGIESTFEEALRIIEEQPWDHTGTHARYSRPDGSSRHLRFHRSQLEDHDKVFGIIIEISDVTSIYRLHEREKQSLEQKRQAESLRAQSLRRFSAAVAHQIRNPLVVIGGFSSRLLKGNTLGEKQREWIAAIEESGQRLDEIVKAVSEYSSVKVGQRSMVPLGQLCDDARQMARSRHPEEADRARWDLPGGGPELPVDRELFARALCELFSNSLEAAPDAAHVEVSFRRSSRGMVLSMRDDGPGFDEEDLPFVFDPFYSTKPVGVGMGLCLAEHIFREHGFRVDVGNGSKKGARLDIAVPRAGLSDESTEGEMIPATDSEHREQPPPATDRTGR